MRKERKGKGNREVEGQEQGGGGRRRGRKGVEDGCWMRMRGGRKGEIQGEEGWMNEGGMDE